MQVAVLMFTSNEKLLANWLRCLRMLHVQMEDIIFAPENAKIRARYGIDINRRKMADYFPTSQAILFFSPTVECDKEYLRYETIPEPPGENSLDDRFWFQGMWKRMPCFTNYARVVIVRADSRLPTQEYLIPLRGDVWLWSWLKALGDQPMAMKSQKTWLSGCRSDFPHPLKAGQPIAVGTASVRSRLDQMRLLLSTQNDDVVGVDHENAFLQHAAVKGWPMARAKKNEKGRDNEHNARATVQLPRWRCELINKKGRGVKPLASMALDLLDILTKVQSTNELSNFDNISDQAITDLGQKVFIGKSFISVGGFFPHLQGTEMFPHIPDRERQIFLDASNPGHLPIGDPYWHDRDREEARQAQMDDIKVRRSQMRITWPNGVKTTFSKITPGQVSGQEPFTTACGKLYKEEYQAMAGKYPRMLMNGLTFAERYEKVSTQLDAWLSYERKSFRDQRTQAQKFSQWKSLPETRERFRNEIGLRSRRYAAVATTGRGATHTLHRGSQGAPANRYSGFGGTSARSSMSTPISKHWNKSSGSKNDWRLRHCGANSPAARTPLQLQLDDLDEGRATREATTEIFPAARRDFTMVKKVIDHLPKIGHYEPTEGEIAFFNEIRRCDFLPADFFEKWLDYGRFNTAIPRLDVKLLKSVSLRYKSSDGFSVAWTDTMRKDVAAYLDNMLQGDVLIQNTTFMERYLHQALDANQRAMSRRILSKDLVPSSAVNFLISLYNHLLEIEEETSPFA